MPVQHVELAPNLWCVVFFPLVAAIAIAYFGLTLGDASEREKTEATKTMTRIAAAGPLASLGVALYYAFALVQLPASSRYLLLHVGNLLRIGQLDANVDLALDPLSATFLVVVTAIGGAVALLLSTPAKEPAWRHLARLDALVAAVLLFLLADNFWLALIGWGATGALASSLAKSSTVKGASARRISFVAARVSDGALLIAAASLFWSFGGTFSDGDYVPDLDARYVAVSSAVPMPSASTSASRAAPGAKGLLTLASTPGALIFADEAHTPLENTGNPARSPIVRQSVDAGMHTFRVHPGAGLDDSIIAHVRFVEGGEVAFVLVGATSVFREMRDQLSLTDDHGSHWRKDALIARRAMGSLGAVTFACLLLLLAAAIRGAAAPFEAWLAGASESATLPGAVLLQAIAGCTGVYLLARVSFLFELSAIASTVTAAVGAATALVASAAALACTASELLRLVAHVAAACFGFALLAFGCGSTIDAVVIAAIAAFAIGALTLAHARAPSLASEGTSRVASVCLAVAPIPGAGISFGVLRALGAALVSDRLVHIPGSLLVACGVVATSVLSLAIWKWIYIAYKKEDKKPAKNTKKSAAKPIAETTPASERQVSLALVGVAVVLGLVFDLGVVSGHPFTTDASWFAGWLTPALSASTARESSAVDAIVFALGFGGALAAFAHARNRSLVHGALEKRDPRLEAWGVAHASNGGLLARGAAAITTRASMLARDTDRFVIDGVLGAGAGVIRLASRLLGGGRR